MKRYVMLLAIVIGLGLAASLVGRSLVLSERPGTAPAARPGVTLDLTIGRGRDITPAVASVPKDHLVRLRVTNRDVVPRSLTLMGYEDRLGVVRVPPDSVWRGEFVSDRPGDDFAWMLEGAPVGRLAVAGSHLVEGHR